MRIKAVISYDGSHFFGFQSQKHTSHTITTAIEEALISLGIDSRIVGSGRTDAGVHATGQIIHFDIPAYWSDLHKLKTHLNSRLAYIQCKHLTPVSDDFHARFDAKRRVYRYIFSDRSVSLFERDYVAQIACRDCDSIQKALELFVGRHDFEYFHKTGSDPHNTVRTIYNARYKKLAKHHAIYFEADGFLRSQVRMMLSATFGVANGTLSIPQLHEQLQKIKKHTHTLAPAQGLYLARVIY